MRSAKVMAAMLAIGVLPGAMPMGEVEIAIDGLRSQKGLLQFCLTANERSFPDCEDDPAARRMTVPAAEADIRFTNLPPGDYALAVVHDENGNDRLDTFVGIPREGVGFSRNPRLGFGVPRFAKVLFPADGTVQHVRMKYFL